MLFLRAFCCLLLLWASGVHALTAQEALAMVQGEGGTRVQAIQAAVAKADAATLARQLFQLARRDPKLKIIPTVERELVIQALKETDNNQVHAAKMLGITRATLRKRIEKFGILRELNVK